MLRTEMLPTFFLTFGSAELKISKRTIGALTASRVAGALGRAFAAPPRRKPAAERKKEAELLDEVFEGAYGDGGVHYNQILGGPPGLSGADEGGAKPKSAPRHRPRRTPFRHPGAKEHEE